MKWPSGLALGLAGDWEAVSYACEEENTRRARIWKAVGAERRNRAEETSLVWDSRGSAAGEAMAVSRSADNSEQL
jgi:hypothetical protein